MTSLSDENLEPMDNLPAVRQQSLTTNVEQARAIEEVQASIIIAKRFPRDETAAFAAIMKACERFSLADQAMYAFPRSDKTVQGPSIRLAEVLAMNWGNMDHGWEELERSNGRSKCVSYCWDKQSNNRKQIKFEVEHWMEVGKKGAKIKKTLTDPRDIYEMCANQASRRMRVCILANIPGDVVDAAVKACKRTLAKGDGATLEDRIRETVTRFQGVGVSQEMIEERLGHKAGLMTGEEIAELIPIYRSIAEKQRNRSDFFNTGEAAVKPKSSLSEKLKGEADPKPEGE